MRGGNSINRIIIYEVLTPNSINLPEQLYLIQLRYVLSLRRQTLRQGTFSNCPLVGDAQAPSLKKRKSASSFPSGGCRRRTLEPHPSKGWAAIKQRSNQPPDTQNAHETAKQQPLNPILCRSMPRGPPPGRVSRCRQRPQQRLGASLYHRRRRTSCPWRCCLRRRCRRLPCRRHGLEQRCLKHGVRKRSEKDRNDRDRRYTACTCTRIRSPAWGDRRVSSICCVVWLSPRALSSNLDIYLQSTPSCSMQAQNFDT